MSQGTRNQRVPTNPGTPQPPDPQYGPNHGNPHTSPDYPDDAFDSAPRQSGIKTRPIHEIRIGRVRAAIWENYTEQGDVRYNVTVVRTYKQDEHWRESQSFGRDDLPLAVKALDQCHTWIFSQRPARSNIA